MELVCLVRCSARIGPYLLICLEGTIVIVVDKYFQVLWTGTGAYAKVVDIPGGKFYLVLAGVVDVYLIAVA